VSGWISDWQLDWPLQWHGFEQSADVDGYGDGGVATLVLDLENGYTVHHNWATDIIKARSGVEQRISRNDTDRESYAGKSIFGPRRARDLRALMARAAAIGSRFLLGLPHEALTLRAAVSSTTIPVHSTALALSDWPRPGQRAVIVTRNGDDEPIGVDVIVQGRTSNTIEIDVSVTAPAGAAIMPAKAVYLEPQQTFPRYRVDVEEWSLAARSAVPMDFAPGIATLALPGIFAGLTAIARQFGIIGNLRTLELVAHPGVPDEGLLTQTAGFTLFRFKNGVTTIADFMAAMETATYLRLVGAPVDENATIASGDAFIDVCTGGTDMGDVGTGATIAEYEDAPVWDMRLAAQSLAEDGVHAMTSIIDHGGAPYALATADRADWYRSVRIFGGRQAAWQWFKLFMFTVRARQKQFWLPTWRDDLVYDSHSGDELTIDADEGDFTAWWPAQRQHVQIEQGSTITYAEVEAAEDNGDGTRTLTLSVSLSADPVTRIGWLELCRFENADTYETTHTHQGFEVALVARVVP